RCLQRASEDLKAGLIDALGTAPLNKHNIKQEGFNFPRHTEYPQAASESKEAFKVMVREELRVGVVTGHIAVKDSDAAGTVDSILYKLRMMNDSLRADFWIQKPKIAVLGLNPHAGDDGLIATEDLEIIRTAIEKANEEGVFCLGPYPADGFFAADAYTKFDAVLAMYHDQGLIPFKHIASRTGINFTAGLPVVRTSPDHGTGYDIAGQNLASHTSFVEAMFEAVHIVNRRREQAVLTENPLSFRRLSKDRD